MKRLGMWAGAFAILGTILFTGCGGDDEEGGAPFFAPTGLRARTYTLIGAAGPTSITFAEGGNTYAVTGGDVQFTPIGSYSASRSGNLWIVRATSQDARFTSELLLNFNGPGRGTYRLTEPGWLQSVVGTFEETGFAGIPDPGSTTTGGGGPGIPTVAPAQLTSITLTENPANPFGRGTVTITFASGTTGIFSTGTRSGNFTYRQLPSAGGSTASLRLNYTGTGTPDFEDYTLQFFEDGSGTFAGVQQIANVQGPATGTFTYSAP